MWHQIKRVVQHEFLRSLLGEMKMHYIYLWHDLCRPRKFSAQLREASAEVEYLTCGKFKRT